MKKTFLFLGFLLFANIIFAQYWTASGNNIYNTLPGWVGIGTAPSYSLDVAGTIHSSYDLVVDQATGNNIGGWFRGPANASGVIVLHGNQGNWPAWGLTGSAGYLKIGGNGGNETFTGAINIDQSFHVGINTLNTSGYTFNVNGTAVFDAITVKTFSSTNPRATPWADYVFDKSYQLPSLQSVADYIRKNRHLPGIPTTEEVQKNGLDLGATQARLLEKIEQLTLYTIDQQKQADEYRDENKKLMQLVEAQNERFAALQQQIDELKRSLQVK